jgi:Asp-tRNA(Asn)/Glu-tRNA(Gln) amidotransferase C subunit
MKKHWAVLVAAFVLTSLYGCASTDALNSRITALEDRVGKLEQVQKVDTASLENDLKKVNDAADRADAAAKKAEDAAIKSESAEKAASGAQEKAQAAAQKSEKIFELIQKK